MYAHPNNKPHEVKMLLKFMSYVYTYYNFIPLLVLLSPGKQLDHNHGILFVILLHTTSCSIQ